MEEVTEQDMKWYLAEVLPEIGSKYEETVSAYALSRQSIATGTGSDNA